MALRLTRGTVKSQDIGTFSYGDASSTLIQSSENFAPARDAEKQLLGGKIGSTLVPNIGITTRGGLRSTNTRAGPSVAPSRQFANNQAAGTSHGLRSKNLPTVKPHVSLKPALAISTKPISEVKSVVGKSKENASSESDSNENAEKEAVHSRIDSNVQLHAKPERQASAMEISPDHTLSEALPTIPDNLSRPPIHAIDSADLAVGTPLVLPTKSSETTLPLQSSNQVLPELCRRLESFSIFKESGEKLELLIDSTNVQRRLKQPIESPEYDLDQADEGVLDTLDGKPFWNEYDAYMRLLERQPLVRVGRQFFDQNWEIRPHMRSIVVDWLSGVHHRLRLLPETFYIAVQLLDRYTQLNVATVDAIHKQLASPSASATPATTTSSDNVFITKKNFQLVGATALFIACKYEEMYAPTISDMLYMMENAYGANELKRMERSMLQNLKYFTGQPYALLFLRRYSRAARVEQHHHNAAKYLLELSLLDHGLMHVEPSKMAASALLLSLSLLMPQESSNEVTVENARLAIGINKLLGVGIRSQVCRERLRTLLAEAKKAEKQTRGIWAANDMVHYSRYSMWDLLPVVCRIAYMVVKVQRPDYKLQNVFKRYSTALFGSIAIRLANSPLLENLANMGELFIPY